MNTAEFKSASIVARLDEIGLRLSAGEKSTAIKAALGLNRYELSHLKRLHSRLSVETKRLIQKNGLSEGHAKALARVKGDTQDNLVRDTIQRSWSVRILESAVRAALAGEEFKEPSKNAKYYEQLSVYLSDHLGHPVQVEPDKVTGNGKIVITYFGFDAFDGILERLRIKLPENL